MWIGLKNAFRDGWLHPRYIAQREIARFVRAHGCRLKGKLLDVGCGKKPYASFFPTVTTYVGMDVPSTMHGIQHADVVGSVLEIPFGPAEFDSVLCTEVLEHTPDPERAMREMARVTKPGGTLLLTVPFSEQFHEEPHDYCRFTEHWLKHLLGTTGWRLQTISRRGGAWLELAYRCSSLLYSEFGAVRQADGLRPRTVLGPPVVLACAAVQLAGAGLDRINECPLSTIGFGVVASRI